MEAKMMMSLKVWETECYRHILNEVKFLSECLIKNQISSINMLDIGANVGCMYDLVAHDFTVKKAHLIEPVPVLFEFLQQKFANNPTVTLHNFCLSNETNMVRMTVPDFEDPHILDIDRITEFGTSRIVDNGKLDVQSYKLDDIFKKNRWTNINVVKIDTESVDFQILSTMHNFIEAQKTRPIIVFENNWSYSMTREKADFILEWYHNNGYNLSLYDELGIPVMYPN